MPRPAFALLPLIAALLITPLLPSGPAPLAAEADLLIRDVQLVDPEHNSLSTPTSVWVADGRIVQIGAAGDWRAARQTLDGAGRYLTPGLIDSHVHLYHATGLKPRYSRDYPALFAGFQRQQPRSYLYWGYTTLIELNADAAANATFLAAPDRPDLQHCGQGVLLSNDFQRIDYDSDAAFFAAQPAFLHDRHRTPELPAGLDPAAHTPAAVVAARVAAGARCIKIYYEEALWWPGASPPAFALPSPAIVRELVQAAHAAGLKVVLHATTPEGFRLGLAAGVDVFAHGLWEWPDMRYEDAPPPLVVQAVQAQIAASGIGLQPTLQTLRNTPLSMFEPALLDDPDWRRVLSQDYLDYLRGDAQRQRDDFLQRMQPTLERALGAPATAANLPPALRAHIQRYERGIAGHAAAGGRLLFATDTAVGGAGWGNPPGLNGFWEMQGWQRAGLSPAHILRAATIDNARAFGLNDRGRIAVGLRADLLLLDANPLQDVTAFRHLHTVIVAGKPLARHSLRAP